MKAAKRQEHAAYRACHHAGVPGDFNKAVAVGMVNEAGYYCDSASLPYECQRAAAALLSAAVAHTLIYPENKPPKTMQWVGRRWYLSHWGSGRIHVSPCPCRSFGMVTGYDFHVLMPSRQREGAQ